MNITPLTSIKGKYDDIKRKFSPEATEVLDAAIAWIHAGEKDAATDFVKAAAAYKSAELKLASKIRKYEKSFR